LRATRARQLGRRGRTLRLAPHHGRRELRGVRPGLKGPKGAFMRERVTNMRFTFESEGNTLLGNLFLPEAEPAGAVVAVGPLTSVKEQAAGTYAQALADRGFAALAFDYRYFGETAGRPRQFEDPDATIEDIKNAATALLADERLNDAPLFGVGVCFGAGPMVRTVAEDRRFRAFAGVAGVYTDNAETKARMGDA